MIVVHGNWIGYKWLNCAVAYNVATGVLQWKVWL
jgi:hypothetical protein